MTYTMTRATAAATIAAVLLLGGVRVAAQRMAAPPAGAPAVLDQPGVTPGEIQRMFDAAALVRAQEFLHLADEKYLPFLTKYKALQDVRHRMQQERNRLLGELRRLANDPGSDESQLKDRIKALQDVEAREQGDIRKAYEGVDSVLDVRQQARFRLFEEQMERLKIELITKARQANRPQRKTP